MLPIREELPARIAREYELGMNTNEPPSIYADEALQAIWEGAPTRNTCATATRLGCTQALGATLDRASSRSREPERSFYSVRRFARK